MRMTWLWFFRSLKSLLSYLLALDWALIYTQRIENQISRITMFNMLSQCRLNSLWVNIMNRLMTHEILFIRSSSGFVMIQPLLNTVRPSSLGGISAWLVTVGYARSTRPIPSSSTLLATEKTSSSNNVWILWPCGARPYVGRIRFQRHEVHVDTGELVMMLWEQGFCNGVQSLPHREGNAIQRLRGKVRGI